QQEAGEIHVGRGQFGANVDHENNRLRFVQGDLSLAIDLRRNERDVIGNDAAGVDDAEVASAPLGFAVEAVAGDAGLIADDGAAASNDAVEERGLADVGASDDGDGGEC